MAESGKVLKVYGGALSKSFQYPFQEGNVYAKEAKKEIASKAISLIQSGMTILVGGGTSMIELARLVPKDVQCTFFTISPLVALELAEKENLEVFLLGGKLSRNTREKLVWTASLVKDRPSGLKSLSIFRIRR